MNILTKNIGFLLILCAVQPSFAAMVNRSAGGATGRGGDSRVSVATSPTMAAMRRLPTIIKATSTTTTSTTSSSSSTTSDSSLLTQNECIEQYSDCIKATDVCGFDFEECTTTELFYAKKPQCNSVLLQCDSDGINALFGTSDTTAFANKNDDGTFVYPTAGSILGQYIEAGHISNLYDTSTCVKRVTSCLHKENVCGSEFELCTSNKEFKKQKVFCESNLARCQPDGIRELFGSTDSSSNPSSTSRLGVLITEGADLAAVNAVSTCYKVTDQCILSTCKANPYKCITDSSLNIATITDSINEGTDVRQNVNDTTASDARTSAMVSSFIRGACMDTIGGNKYCHMTVNEGRVPSASQLIDEDAREEVYSDLYASRMNAAMRSKIQDFANEFDKKTKSKCVDVMMSCAMRSCGSGLGSLCYKKVFGTGNSADDFRNSINGTNTYAEIQNGCAAIVNTDANCQYAAAVSNSSTGGYTYAYNDGDTFTTLFPVPGAGDPIGVVERLNAALAENYNDAAIAKLAKDCRATAVSCIKSMCGSDYTNCYRNRTDIMSDTYDTGNAAFDNSMNKVGGVLDFNIIRGLCVETVKNASTCDEHLKINSVRYMSDDTGANGWGNNDVRTAWNDATKTGYKQTKSYDHEVLIGCTVGDSATTEACKNKQGNPNMIEDCGYMDDDGCLYDKEYYQTETDYAFSMASDTLFQEVLGDIEKEAQAKYNAKLTKEQNMCVGANNGGLMGARDMSSTYMWVKLKSKRIPKNYSISGLKVNDFVASNDLYGSFCRARITIQSDDPDIQSALQKKNQNWSTAYFAVGDVFTCGSWIPQDKLQEIATIAACKKAKKDGTIDRSTDCTSGDAFDKVGLTTGQKWGVAAATIGSAGVGIAGMELLQSKTGLGGLLGTSADKIDTCQGEFDTLVDNINATWNYLKKSKKCTIENTDDGVRAEWKSGGTIRKSNFGKSFSKRTLKEAESACLANSEIEAYISDANIKQEEICGKDDKASVGKRLLTDAAGAAALGTVGFLATRNNIRDSNRQKFTADEEAFMREVGDHIYCFIGADEAGNYGDLIEISVE